MTTDLIIMFLLISYYLGLFSIMIEMQKYMLSIPETATFDEKWHAMMVVRTVRFFYCFVVILVPIIPFVWF